MAYKAKYKRNVKVDSNRKKVENISLYTKFNFWNETPPRDRAMIRHRIKSFFEKKKEKVPDEYLFEYNEKSSIYIYRGLYDKIFLKFDISLHTGKNISLEKIVDLDGINKFILTGKRPNKNN